MPALSAADCPMMIGPVPNGVPVMAALMYNRVPMALLANTKPPENVLSAPLVKLMKAVPLFALLVMSWILLVGPSVIKAASVGPAVLMVMVLVPLPAPLLVRKLVDALLKEPMV